MSTRFICVFGAIALAACTRTAELPASLVAEEAEAVFDTVVNAPSATRRIAFTNIGDTRTAPLEIAISGDRALFNVDGDDCSGSALEPHATCEVVVRLAGLTDGEFDGELRVFGAQSVGASVLLHGKVMPTALSLAPVSSSSVDAKQGDRNVLVAYAVSNSGGATSGELHVSGIGLPFAIRDGGCEGLALEGGATCTIELTRNVEYSDAVGAVSGTLQVSASPGGTLTATPQLVVHAGGIVAVGGDVDWGTLPSLTPTAHTLTLSNPGLLDSGTLAVSIGEKNSTYTIARDDCSGQSLSGGKSCTIDVSDETSAMASYNATLHDRHADARHHQDEADEQRSARTLGAQRRVPR